MIPLTRPLVEAAACAWGPRSPAAAAAREAGIETTLGTYAMHAHPAFAGYGYRPGDLPHSYRAQQASLTVPLWPGMGEGVVESVVAQLRRVVEGGA